MPRQTEHIGFLYPHNLKLEDLASSSAHTERVKGWVVENLDRQSLVKLDIVNLPKTPYFRKRGQFHTPFLAKAFAPYANFWDAFYSITFWLRAQKIGVGPKQILKSKTKIGQNRACFIHQNNFLDWQKHFDCLSFFEVETFSPFRFKIKFKMFIQNSTSFTINKYLYGSEIIWKQ